MPQQFHCKTLPFFLLIQLLGQAPDLMERWRRILKNYSRQLSGCYKFLVKLSGFREPSMLFFLIPELTIKSVELAPLHRSITVSSFSPNARSSRSRGKEIMAPVLPWVICSRPSTICSKRISATSSRRCPDIRARSIARPNHSGSLAAASRMARHLSPIPAAWRCATSFCLTSHLLSGQLFSIQGRSHARPVCLPMLLLFRAQSTLRVQVGREDQRGLAFLLAGWRQEGLY